MKYGVFTIAIGVAVKNEKPYFLTYLFVKLTLFSIKAVAKKLLADKSPLCAHVP